jgi:hypothetical protein
MAGWSPYEEWSDLAPPAEPALAEPPKLVSEGATPKPNPRSIMGYARSYDEPPAQPQAAPAQPRPIDPKDPFGFLRNHPKYIDRTRDDAPALDLSKVKDVVLHDRGGKYPGNSPYHLEVLPDGSIVNHWRSNQKAPHAYKFNPYSLGVAYGGQVGETPTLEAQETLKFITGKLREQNPDWRFRSHGEVFRDTRGTDAQASRDGRGMEEASWRSNLGGPEVAYVERPPGSAIPPSSAIQTASAPAGPVASVSPRRSKPMSDSAESGGGFFGFLSKPMNILGNPQNADILARAGPQGYQPIDADAFLEKHGLKHIPGAKDLIAISNMQRDLSASALHTKQPTWADGIGEALKGVGAVLSSRVDPKMAMTMAGSVGQSHRDQQEMVKKLAMQQLLQQASGLGDNLSDTVKTRLAELHKRETRQGDMARIFGGAAPTAAGAGASVGTAPVGAVSREEIGAPGGVPAPSAGIGPAGPSVAPPATSGSAPTTNTAPAVGQPSQTPSVPGSNPQFPMPDLPSPSPEAAALRRQADAAHAAGYPEIAKDFSSRAEAVEKRHIDEWTIKTKPQREAAEAAMKKEAEIAAGEKQKLQKARENAVAMGGLFDNLKKHGRVDGIEGVIGPFDNSYVGRMIADFKPWGPAGADAGVRSLIEGDMAALSAIAKKITHNPGDGNFSDSDQKLLIQAIGAVLDAPNKEAYDKAIDEAKKRAERLLGTSIPTEKVTETSTGEKKTEDTSVRVPSEKALAAIRANAENPAVVAAFEKTYGPGSANKYLGSGDPFGDAGQMLRPGADPQQPAMRPARQPNAKMTAQERYQQAIKKMYMEGRDG